MEPIVVPMPKGAKLTAALEVAIVCAAPFLCLYAIFFYQASSTGMHLYLTWIALGALGGLALIGRSAIRMNLKFLKEPLPPYYLTVDEQGLHVTLPKISLSWDEIGEVRLVKLNRVKFIGVVPKDTSATLSHVDKDYHAMMKYNVDRTGVPIMLRTGLFFPTHRLLREIHAFRTKCG